MKRTLSILFALALVLSFSLVATTPVAAQSTYYVAKTGLDTNAGSSGSPWLTIQHAVSTAPAGSTIIVRVGEYQEQLTIATNGLTIKAESGAAVTIKAPDYVSRTRIVKPGWPQNCYDYIIRVTASGVTIEGFTVEGHEGMYNGTQHRHCDDVWRGTAQGDVSRDPRRVGFFGIWYDGAITGGQVKNNTVTDVVAWTASAITVSGGAEVVVENNVIPIHVWGNVGIMAEGTGTIVTAHKNAMSGTVGTSHWSQGGIQFGGAAGGGGATGSATYNTVQNLRSGTGAMSTGIGVYEGAELDLIQHNTIDNTDCAILLWGWSVDTKVSEIRDNTLNNSRYYGIAVYEGGEVDHIEHNTLDGNAWGILTYPWLGRAAQINFIQCNAIRNNTSGGIRFLPDTVLPAVHYNNIFGNALGLRNDCVLPVDATLNWWGQASGPTHTSNAGGTGDAVSDNVNFTPWLGAVLAPAMSVAPVTGGTASFATSGGSILTLTAITPPAGAPAGVTFPHGMFEFEICCLDQGDTVTLIVTLPSNVPVGTRWWKYQAGSWYSLPNLNDNGNNIMMIQLTDSGPGDSDSIPGQITDPGGPGWGPTVGWQGSPVNRLAVMAPWIALLAAMMAGGGLLVLRRRQARM